MAKGKNGDCKNLGCGVLWGGNRLKYLIERRDSLPAGRQAPLAATLGLRYAVVGYGKASRNDKWCYRYP